MNWITRFFSPWGLVLGELIFPASVADGTLPPGYTPSNVIPTVKALPGGGIVSITTPRKAPENMDTQIIIAAIVAAGAAVLILGAK